MVKEYITYCPDCIKNKVSKQKTVGDMRPIDVRGSQGTNNCHKDIMHLYVITDRRAMLGNSIREEITYDVKASGVARQAK